MKFSGNFVNIAVLPTAVKAFGIDSSIPQRCADMFAPIGKWLFESYEPGSALKYARHPLFKIKRDHKEIKSQLLRADRLEEPAVFKPGDMEYFEVCDIAGVAVSKMMSWQAHRVGARHKSVDIIVVLPDNSVILQKRSSNRYVFPEKWAVSVGGHVTSTPDKKVTLDPRTSALHELEGELGLKIDDINRLRPIKEDGINKYLQVWKCDLGEVEIAFYQFDPARKYCALEVKEGSLGSEAKGVLLQEFKRGGNVGQLYYWNNEINYCYMLKISRQEAESIHYKDGEVNGHKAFSLSEMIAMGADMDQCSDTFFSLSRLRPNITDHLEKLAASIQ